jgi:hypothetical protein
VIFGVTKQPRWGLISPVYVLRNRPSDLKDVAGYVRGVVDAQPDPARGRPDDRHRRDTGRGRHRLLDLPARRAGSVGGLVEERVIRGIHPLTGQRRTGSVLGIIPAADLRPRLISAVERGIARTSEPVHEPTSRGE